MDKTYRKEQLAFVEGRKEQFLNELFGGQDIRTNEYINMKFNDIQHIEVKEVIPLKDGSYNYIFSIRDGQHLLLRSLLLNKDGRRYGFIGSVG